MKKVEKSIRDIKRSMFTSIIIFAVVLSVVLGLISYRNFSDEITARYDDYLNNVAEICLSVLDGDQLENCIRTGEKDDAYQRMQRSLDNIKNTQYAERIYAVIPINHNTSGNMMYVITGIDEESSAQKPDRQPSLGDVSKNEYAPETLYLFEDIMSGKTDKTIYESSSTESGPVHTILFPVRNSQEKPVCILAIDITITEIRSNLSHFATNMALFSLLILAAFLIISLLWLKRRVTNLLQKLQEANIRAKEQVEQASRTITNFLLSMSHDIRTPLNAIGGYLDFAVKRIDDRKKVLDYLGKAQQAESLLLSLINNVLEVSRIEAGRSVLDEQYGDVYFSFSTLENTLMELANDKDIQLSFEFGDIRNRYVMADFNRCNRIFVNVISNAIKYTPAGGTVKVRCEQNGDISDGMVMYRYIISDNGIGMSEEFQKHIFEHFARENNSTVSGIQGTGLGMSVVKSFVDLMGGTIEINSRQGVGTTFIINLPFKVQEGSIYTDPVTGKVIGITAVESKPDRTYFKGKKALIVDDNDFNREIAIEMLQDEGILVESAANGQEALDLLKEKGTSAFDFILMDIQMPVLNGYETTKKIRGLYPDAGIPIIALSANAFSEDHEKSIAAGMNDHVNKPVNIDELFSILSKYM